MSHLKRSKRSERLPQHFQILDSEDQQRVIKRLINGLVLDEKCWPAHQTQWFINVQKGKLVRLGHTRMTSKSILRPI